MLRQETDEDNPTSWWHVLYVNTSACPRFVGVLQTARITCMTTQSNGLCNLDLIVRAGSDQHDHMRFDGVRYRR